MSDGASTRNRRITRPYFRTCSTCWSRSQAPLCPYTLQLIADQLEGTFGRLRYFFGGDRPSQTAHLTLFRDRIHGRRLEFQHIKSGISRTAPRQLASPLQSLPPILHKMNQNPISGYSKGSRGLSVFLRVAGIFTGNAISPSPSLRQCPSRYAIRAGRNLPDKEFRYLRHSLLLPTHGLAARSFPSGSPCRHGVRTISSSSVKALYFPSTVHMR